MSVTTEMEELLETGRARGPLSKVLTKYWNELHDLEYDLEQVSQEYDEAASYRGAPGERDAKNVMKAIRQLHTRLAVARSGVEKLLSAESDFVAKHGTPEAYQSSASRAFGFR